MKNYDFEKAKKLILENAGNLQSASLGMHEDWFWTAETVWESGDFTKKLNENAEIAGIAGSLWATPTLQLSFEDGSDKMIPAYVGESDPNDSGGRAFAEMSRGVLSGQTQENITPLSEE